MGAELGVDHEHLPHRRADQADSSPPRDASRTTGRWPRTRTPSYDRGHRDRPVGPGADGGCPSSPDSVKPVRELAGKKVGQIAVGCCTNSSFADLMMAARVLKGRRIDPIVEFAIAPGSRQVLNMLAANGALADLIAAGARILESACGPCIGQGFSPADGTVSLRTFNRNFTGRTGTKGDQVYLVSPETAVASALTGEVTDPRDLSQKMGIEYPKIKMPREFQIDDSMIEPPCPRNRRRRPRSCGAARSSCPKRTAGPAGPARRAGPAQVRRQDHDRPHHARRDAPEAPLQRAGVRQGRVQLLQRSRASRPSPSGR